MISKLNSMAERRDLLGSLRRSLAGLVSFVTIVLTCGSLTGAVANGKLIATRHTIFLAGTPRAILDMAGAGILHLSVIMRDQFGIATAKVTFAVLIRSTVGILVTAT
jgi:hypothetical protein